MKKVFLPILFAALGLLLISCSTHDIVTYSNFKSTYSEFRQNAPNMSLSDVEKIVGTKGKLSKGEYVDGIIVATLPGQEVYYWENKDESNMSISVLNGKVTSVAQHNLD